VSVNDNDIKEEEVRELLEEKLIGAADAVKLKALVTLATRLASGTRRRTPESEDNCKAMENREGCRKVLTVLQWELDKGEACTSGPTTSSAAAMRRCAAARRRRDRGESAVQAIPKTTPHISSSLAVRLLFNLTCGTGAASRLSPARCRR
jgi:hypothetical protein